MDLIDEVREEKKFEKRVQTFKSALFIVLVVSTLSVVFMIVQNRNKALISKNQEEITDMLIARIDQHIDKERATLSMKDAQNPYDLHVSDLVLLNEILDEYNTGNHSTEYISHLIEIADSLHLSEKTRSVAKILFLTYYVDNLSSVTKGYRKLASRYFHDFTDERQCFYPQVVNLYALSLILENNAKEANRFLLALQDLESKHPGVNTLYYESLSHAAKQQQTADVADHNY